MPHEQPQVTRRTLLAIAASAGALSMLPGAVVAADETPALDHLSSPPPTLSLLIYTAAWSPPAGRTRRPRRTIVKACDWKLSRSSQSIGRAMTGAR
jgi:hypothetical protein